MVVYCTPQFPTRNLRTIYWLLKNLIKYKTLETLGKHLILKFHRKQFKKRLGWLITCHICRFIFVIFVTDKKIRNTYLKLCKKYYFRHKIQVLWNIERNMSVQYLIQHPTNVWLWSQISKNNSLIGCLLMCRAVTGNPRSTWTFKFSIFSSSWFLMIWLD